MALSPSQYDVLERAVARGARIAVTRRGTQWIVVAHQLRVEGREESLITRHPSTGDAMIFLVGEIERLELIS